MMMWRCGSEGCSKRGVISQDVARGRSEESRKEMSSEDGFLFGHVPVSLSLYGRRCAAMEAVDDMEGWGTLIEEEMYRRRERHGDW